MTVQVHDPRYGHLAIFYTASASASSSTDVHWGPDSIQVPAESSLNGPAQVWLRLPDVSTDRFVAWCNRNRFPFLGRTRHHHLGFRVSHFSRYRYVDSESESDDETESNVQPVTSNRPTSVDKTKKSPSKRSQATQPGAAAEATANPTTRRRQFRAPLPVSTALSGDKSPHQKDDTRKPEQRAQRPRMSTRLLEDLDTDPDPEDSEHQTLRGNRVSVPYNDNPVSSETVDADQKTDPHASYVDDTADLRARETFEARFAYGSDLPKLHRFRETLFSEVEEPANQSGIPGLDIDMADVPATPARRTSLEDLAEHTFFKPGLVSDDDSENDNDENSAAAAELSPQHEASNFADGSQPNQSSMLPIPPLAPPSFPILKESLLADSHHMFTDIGLLLGRSFQTSFSFCGALARPTYSPLGGFTVSIEELNAGEIPLQALVAGLRVHSAMWFAHKDARNEAEKHTAGVRVPTLHAAFNDGMQSNATLKHVIYELDIARESGDANARHAGIAFRLLLALYSIDEDEEPDENALLQRVSSWGADASDADFDCPLEESDPPLRHAVVQLSIGNVEVAVHLAVELGFPRLALLMSRALESQKEQLREDAIAQLSAYGLRLDEKPTASQELERRTFIGGDRVLKLCEEDAKVSLEERMILLILAGHVAPVARHLNFSWYRLFTMELLYGAGSSDLSHQDRVCAAVRAVEGAGIPTLAPHLCPAEERTVDSTMNNDTSADRDVAYHILRLYADSGNKRALTSGIYSNSSFGVQHRPQDSRFCWLLHEVLSALIPEASPKEASAKLADELSTQLRTANMRLWAYYVLCCSGVPAYVLHATLLRDWPLMEEEAVELDASIKLPGSSLSESDNQMDNDVDMSGRKEDNDNMEDEENTTCFINAKQFLIDFLNVPHAWVCEAEAMSARCSGDVLRECELLLDSEDGRLATVAHSALCEVIIPSAVASRDAPRLRRVTKLLERLAVLDPPVPNWTLRGGFVYGYLRTVWRDSSVNRARHEVPSNADHAKELHDLAHQCVTAWDRTRNKVQRAAMQVIADGIATEQRAMLLRDSDVETLDALAAIGCADLEQLPCSRGVKLRISGEYRAGMQLGWSIANRLAAALPAYETALASASIG